jgi:hypothetical protein
MKELGINLLRKHCKVEPDYFYYACDKLGMLVMQDMVNSGSYSFIRDTALPTIGFKKRGDLTGTGGKRKEFFKAHVENTIEQVYNHPSVVAYTIFNEGWGQFESDKMYEYVKSLDATRLADATSGWFAQEKNDFDSEHIYFKAIEMEPKERPMFLSECGGYSMAVEGHYYSKYNVYGYGGSEDASKLTDDIVNLYEVMVLPAAPKGMCGCIYTQLSDVEDEINGLYTYDRKVCKVEKERMTAMAERLQRAGTVLCPGRPAEKRTMPSSAAGRPSLRPKKSSCRSLSAPTDPSKRERAPQVTSLTLHPVRTEPPKRKRQAPAIPGDWRAVKRRMPLSGKRRRSHRTITCLSTDTISSSHGMISGSSPCAT